MYLADIRITAEELGALAPYDMYGWHKLLWHFFPTALADTPRPFLYRVDSEGELITITLLSSIEPQLPETWPTSTNFRVREIPEAFLNHTTYRFQLRANPTRKTSLDKKSGTRRPNGMRVPLIEFEDLRAWILRKGEQSGFTIINPEEALTIVPEGRVGFRKKSFQSAHHASVQFRGILQVTDQDLFLKAFALGIGSAKSFGFGLLMLQPIH